MVITRMVSSKPALVLEEDTGGGAGGPGRHLVVTDLHIGFESRLAGNSVFVGRNTTVSETIEELSGIIRDEQIGSLVLLGDVKSGTASISRSEWNDVPLFFGEMSKLVDVTLVPGNHDAGIQRLIPGGVSLAGPAGLVLGDALLTHGHAMPSENFWHVNKIIMGHVHPIFFEEGSVLNGQRVWVSARVQKQDIFPSARGTIDLLLVPSFNKYLYATHRGERSRSTSPIIKRIRRFDSAQIVTLDGSIIGDDSLLDRVV